MLYSAEPFVQCYIALGAKTMGTTCISLNKLGLAQQRAVAAHFPQAPLKYLPSSNPPIVRINRAIVPCPLSRHALPCPISIPTKLWPLFGVGLLFFRFGRALRLSAMVGRAIGAEGLRRNGGKFSVARDSAQKY